jgi:hypothetical protein
MNPFDNISLDGAELTIEASAGNPRVWYTPDGDGVGLYFFALPPDIPKGAASVTVLQAFHEQRVSKGNTRVVETAIKILDGCKSVYVIMKAPQSPSGMTYVGSFTLPFKDFSYVLKVQCQERGPTGFREAVLYDAHAAARAQSGTPFNFDDAKYDDQFPTHPLSRLRSTLKKIQGAVRIDTRLKSAPPFDLPDA